MASDKVRALTKCLDQKGANPLSAKELETFATLEMDDILELASYRNASTQKTFLHRIITSQANFASEAIEQQFFQNYKKYIEKLEIPVANRGPRSSNSLTNNDIDRITYRILENQDLRFADRLIEAATQVRKMALFSASTVLRDFLDRRLPQYQQRLERCQRLCLPVPPSAAVTTNTSASLPTATMAESRPFVSSKCEEGLEENPIILQQQLKISNQKLATAIEEKQLLEVQLASRNKKISELTQGSSELEQALRHTSSELANMAAKFEQEKTAKVTIENMQGTIKNQFSEARQHTLALEKKIEGYKTLKEQAEKEKARFVADLLKYDTLVDQLSMENNQLKSEVARLTGSNSRFQEDIECLRSKNSQLQQGLDGSREKIEQLSGLIPSLKRMLNQVEEEQGLLLHPSPPNLATTSSAPLQPPRPVIVSRLRLLLLVSLS